MKRSRDGELLSRDILALDRHRFTHLEQRLPASGPSSPRLVVAVALAISPPRPARAGYIIIYGNLQAATTKLYKKKGDDESGRPTGRAACKWAAWCSLAPLVTGM